MGKESNKLVLERGEPRGDRLLVALEEGEVAPDHLDRLARRHHRMGAL